MSTVVLTILDVLQCIIVDVLQCIIVDVLQVVTASIGFNSYWYCLHRGGQRLSNLHGIVVIATVCM